MPRTSGALPPPHGRNGHELMLHFPMEPLDERQNPGRNALMVEHADWEIRLLMDWGVGRVPGIVGVNNHMGSRFTSVPRAMAPVMEYLGESGLFYLDSKTNASEVSAAAAASAGVAVPCARSLPRPRSAGPHGRAGGTAGSGEDRASTRLRDRHRPSLRRNVSRARPMARQSRDRDPVGADHGDPALPRGKTRDPAPRRCDARNRTASRDFSFLCRGRS